ncbi:multiple epidermal growth factor-like domains protein 10 [Haliotis rubra]|uniref:multiple epidermal growth factor-like domains protein 10 n=1 Tax=Haliotis rubra TaxID=36100 RepID=UPI001EE58DB4|nr:multiple epidermal growth factor-like domains protein 10 [Haliotis rubra]
MERGCTLFVLVVLTVSSLVDGQEGSCQPGTFGDYCSYSCNCGSSCNSATGVCAGACDDGWREGNGSLCQKENVAYGKQVSGSGDYSNSWTAKKAVDGNRDQDVTHGSCYHSYYYPTFWWVDLAAEYRIHSVRIYNRAGYPHRLANCSISVGPDSNSETVCYTFPSNRKDIPDVIDLTCNGIGNFFIIRNPGNAPSQDDTLNICEVEIYVCSKGTFGAYCSEFCHCLNSTCDHATGKCPGDCSPGWMGNTCSTQCTNGTYGPNCLKKCDDRHCNGTSSCPPVYGGCTTGCEKGWARPDCSDCTTGFHGPECIECGHCATNTTCDSTTGECGSGCLEGFTGLQCKESVGNGSSVAGAVVGTLLLLLIAVIIAVVVFRWRGKHSSSVRGHHAVFNQKERQKGDDNVYMNVDVDTFPIYATPNVKAQKQSQGYRHS